MPIYDYECPSCGLIEDVWAHIDEQEKLCSCGNWSKRSICAPAIRCDIQPYLDENMGHHPVPVMSRQHKREELKRRGLVEYTKKRANLGEI